MPRAAAVRAADIDRAIKVLIRNGLTVASVVVRAGGEVVITPALARRDDLTAAAPAQQGDDLDAWRARRGDRAAKGA
jgi:hypothetical protein